ncbi:uncharacterized protein V2V93DRAFT_373803 [Kockiozyma suomiensis]|uniref:uncharacterized protein n=1 Tax=Kockiozyma suomiensis TaxID=1337062 RepID=UPI003342FFCB
MNTVWGSLVKIHPRVGAISICFSILANCFWRCQATVRRQQVHDTYFSTIPLIQAALTQKPTPRRNGLRFVNIKTNSSRKLRCHLN